MKNFLTCVLFICIPIAIQCSSLDAQRANSSGGELVCTKSLHKKYDCKLKAMVDKQIKSELEAFYYYLRVGNFFAHEDYYLPGLSKFLLENAQEELKHAQKIIDFQTKRGAYAEFVTIGMTKPNKKTWKSAIEALEDVLALEFKVTTKIEDLHSAAAKAGDTHLQDFLETNFIPEQYDSMKVISDHLKTLKRLVKGECNHAFAEFQFDKLVLKGPKHNSITI